MYSFNYKRGTQSFDRVKSLVDAIDFELPRNWDCSDVDYLDGARFEYECTRFYCDMLRIFPSVSALAARAGELFIHTRCGTGLDFMDEDKLFGGHGKARLFTEYARTYEALVLFPTGETISILWSGRVQQ